MTVIRPNSVSGINSITAQADEIKVFKSNGTQGGLIIGGANLNATTGISTILALNVTGNVSIAGTLTYQDVTNVDSLGIGTFRTGINVSGGQLDVGSNIKIGNAGVITATSFSGSGANLTGIDTDLLSDTSPQLGGDLDTNSHNILLDDSHYLYLGDTNDASLFNDGSNVYLKNYSGGTDIQGTTYVQLRKFNNSSLGLKYIVDGAVELYHNGAKTAYTKSTGFEIKGGNTSDQTELQIIGNEGQDASILLGADDGDDNADYWRMYAQASDNAFTLKNYAAGSYETSFRAVGNGAAELYHNNSKKFDTDSEGISITGTVKINNTSSVGDYNGGADDMLIGTHSGNHGLTILSGTSNGGYIMFSDNNGGGTNAYRGQIEYAHSSDYMRFITDSGERVRILSGGGITFNGDTATANALDDYEEGSWTATAEYGSGGQKSCSNNVCRYVKVGSLVQISGRFSLNTHTGSSGELRIGGLPFSKGNPSGDGNADGIVVYIEGAASNITNSISGLVLDNQTVFYVRRSGTTSSGNDVSGLTDTGTTLLVGGTYNTVA